MKKYVIPVLLGIEFIAAIHFILLSIEFIASPDYQIWNFFNMNQLSRWYPWLNSPSGFIISSLFLAMLYVIFYMAYQSGVFKKHIK